MGLTGLNRAQQYSIIFNSSLAFPSTSSCSVSMDRKHHFLKPKLMIVLPESRSRQNSFCIMRQPWPKHIGWRSYDTLIGGQCLEQGRHLHKQKMRKQSTALLFSLEAHPYFRNIFELVWELIDRQSKCGCRDSIGIGPGRPPFRSQIMFARRVGWHWCHVALERLCPHNLMGIQLVLYSILSG